MKPSTQNTRFRGVDDVAVNDIETEANSRVGREENALSINELA